MPRVYSRPRALLVCAVLGASLLAGCSSNSPSAGGGSGPLTAGVLHAFTGQNAFFGLNAQNACKAAAAQINAAGGILGRTLDCTSFDTKGDPADAVPVTQRMLMSASNLALVVGPDGNDIPSVLPLLQQAKVPELNTVGDPRYDSQTSPYFWRLTPSDSTQAPALADYAIGRSYTRVVELFTSDLSAQTTTAPFESTYKAAGGTIADSLTLSPDQASYQTEVSRVLAAHPQAIVGEMDARTAATFLGELQQQNGGTILPFVVTQRATQADWAPAVLPAIGAADMKDKIFAVAPQLSSPGPALSTFQQAMTGIGANSFQKDNPIVAATYDGIILMALAMDEAGSTDPAKYLPDVAKLTAVSAGATVAATYAAGLAAIKAGRSIRYVGASGPMIFDAHNTANRPYVSWTFDPAAKSWTAGAVVPSGSAQ